MLLQEMKDRSTDRQTDMYVQRRLIQHDNLQVSRKTLEHLINSKMKTKNPS